MTDARTIVDPGQGIVRSEAGGWYYPRFNCSRDLWLFRLGGPGLANSLYIWAKALVLAHRHGGANVFPTWPQVKLGPLLRREPDPRHYIGLFRPAAGDLSGAAKIARLAMTPRVTVARVRDVVDPQERLYIVSDTAFEDHFAELLEDRQLVRQALVRRSVKLPPTGREPFIGVHVRFGDFSAAGAHQAIGGMSHRLPIDWYIERLDAIRIAVGGDAPAIVFSDASADELRPLLAQPNVKLSQGGSALDDIWSLSQAAAIVASTSTFSYWAAYLGEGLVVSRAGAWRTPFDHRRREWICEPGEMVMPPQFRATLRLAGL